MRDGKVCVISPHLDDAVLGCGAFLAGRPGATVVTVCAGTPDPADRLTEWDAACGFASAREAVAMRRAEDRSALALLGARPQWLDYLDDQYGGGPAPARWLADVAHELRCSLRAADTEVVLCPLGLFHRDHERVHAAARLVLAGERHRAWYAYEDALYRSIPGLVQQRLAHLAAHDIVATPVRDAASLASGAAIRAKRQAIRCYASQLRGLDTPGRPGYLDALAPESYWLLSPA
jgi:LmbE family N-acetylglucosaminyl deacetylase